MRIALALCLGCGSSMDTTTEPPVPPPRIQCEDAGHWNLALPAPIIAAELDALGRTYAATASGTLFAVGVDGSIRWSHEGDATALPNHRQVLATGGDHIYWARGDRVVALDAAGEAQWSLPIHGAVAADDTSVAIAAGRAGEVEIRLLTHGGEEDQRVIVTTTSRSLGAISLAMSPEAIAVADQRLYVMDRQTLAARWDTSTIATVNQLAFDDTRLLAAGTTMGELSPPLPDGLNVAAALVGYDQTGESDLALGCCDAGFEYGWALEIGERLYWSGYYGRDFERTLRLGGVTLPAEGQDGFILVVDEDGQVRSGKRIGGSGTDSVQVVRETCAGDIIVGGQRTEGWPGFPKQQAGVLREGYLIRTAAP